MITADDLEFHHDANSDYTWAETYFIPISVPEANLFAFAYICTRPVVGAMTSCIRITGAVSETEWEVLYDDNQEHLPCPDRFSLIDAPNGLRIEAVKPPRDYRIDYSGYDGTEIHVDWNGIMDPWDIHDPQLNPLAGATEEEQYAASSMGSGYKGHFDMHGRVTGEIMVRGKTYQVDSIDRMNHSWGPRPTLDIPSMNALWGSFGERFAFRLHCHLDLDKPTGADQRLAHGYVLDDGDVLAVTDLKMTTTRVGIVPVTMDLEIAVADGRSWTVHGQPINGAPWRSYLTTVTWLGLYRWLHEGEVGYGVAQEVRSFREETRRRGRSWSDKPAYITT
jgi:hypothetical protein